MLLCCFALELSYSLKQEFQTYLIADPSLSLMSPFACLGYITEFGLQEKTKVLKFSCTIKRHKRPQRDTQREAQQPQKHAERCWCCIGGGWGLTCLCPRPYRAWELTSRCVTLWGMSSMVETTSVMLHAFCILSVYCLSSSPQRTLYECHLLFCYLDSWIPIKSYKGCFYWLFMVTLVKKFLIG